MNSKHIIILSLIIVFSLLRLINLDADPGLFKRIGDIGDEGYWGHGARNLALYGQFFTDEFTLDSATAPLNTLFTFVFFQLFGISLYTLRLISAVFGILTIFLAYFFLKRYNTNIALWGTLFLAINYNYFQYNRIGHVETLVSFFILLAVFWFEGRGHWFAGGLSYGAAIAAKASAVYFAPAIGVYFVFRVIKKEIGIKKVMHAVLGGLSIILPLLIYQYYFRDSFELMYREASNALYPSVKSLLLEAAGSIINMHTNQFLKNPINVFLILCLAVYLWKIRFLNILSKNFVGYIRQLSPLDIVIITWVFGYVITLLLNGQFFDDRRLQTLSVVLSFVPAVLLYSHKGPEPFRFEMNFWQRLIYLFPLVLAGRELGIVVVYRLFASSRGAIVGILVSLVAILVISAIYKYLNSNMKRILKIVSLGSLAFALTFQLSFYLAEVGPIDSKSVKLLTILMLTFLFGIFAYFISRKSGLVRPLYAISLLLILFNLLTPAFSIRDASNELNKIISKDDYLIGIRGHMLSYNAQYHPLWWWLETPNYGIVNMEFVKKAKPKYILVRTEEEYGRKVDPEKYPLMPLTKTLNHIGANRLEKVYSFGLFPIWGRYGERYELYKIVY